jgi:hypothetical protein
MLHTYKLRSMPKTSASWNLEESVSAGGAVPFFLFFFFYSFSQFVGIVAFNEYGGRCRDSFYTTTIVGGFLFHE